ncbi:MAG: dihydropteroate synthase [Betaproteobacteria bacterium]|nr:dihydropteroate synthase [Betaproteobacteria bacterium]
MNVLRAGGYRFRLDRPLIMGILNVTPDSFSDGGRFIEREAALEQAHRLVADGADIIDVGGESTRPGAMPVSAVDEMRRILPIVEALAGSFPVSVDTSKPEVMVEALARGAAMINDVRALREPGALDAVREGSAAVCLMHMLGEPRTMQVDPVYGDVVAEVGAFLEERALVVESAGVERERIVIDPGFGFGKTVAHNLELLRRLPELARMGWPLLAGLSRKSMFAKIAGKGVADRLHASVAAAVLAAARGAAIVRVHDVGPTRDALCVLQAIENEGS